MSAEQPTALVAFAALFPEFRAASWDEWRRILERIGPNVREFYCVAGRGSGKSRVSSLIASCCASREYTRAPGERVFVGIFGPDRRQARLTFDYIAGLMRSRPELAALIESEHKGRDTASLTLRNGVTVEVVTASVAAPRGRGYALAIVEEAAFLPQDQSANPDVELLRAVRPGLARVPGSLLCVVSSPYARRGILYDAHKRYVGTGGSEDGRVVYVQAPTLTLNPTFDESAVKTALVEDPIGAQAEYLARFRSDVETFISVEAVELVTVPGRLELPAIAGTSYVGFVDFAGGSGQDSATLAIAHGEKHGERLIPVLDLLREVRPPFSPSEVCKRFASELKRYDVRSAQADRFAGDFPVESMAKLGIDLRPAEKFKSDLYRELLPLLNSQSVELLDNARLAAQLTALERRTARGGRDSIDHAPGGHDDIANAVAGALVMVTADQYHPSMTLAPRRSRRLRREQVRKLPPLTRPEVEPEVFVDGGGRRVKWANVLAYLQASTPEEARLPIEELYRRTAKWMLAGWQMRQSSVERVDLGDIEPIRLVRRRRRRARV